MEYSIRLPHPLLQSYIRYYTYMELGEKDIWTTSAIAPTGCAVMCVIVGDHLTSFRNNNGLVLPQFSLNLTGQVTEFAPFSFFGKHKVVSIIFHPFGACRLLAMGQSCFTDHYSQDFFELLPVRDRAMQQQFLDCQKPEETFSLLEAIFLRLLKQNKEKSNLPKIAYICQQIMKSAHEPLLLKSISREVGFSKSSLERNFKEFVGIGPKQYHRILRFHNLLNHIQQKKDVYHWTEVAHRFGYYDQAHFIKDFKVFYGKTPSSFSTNDGLISEMIQ